MIFWGYMLLVSLVSMSCFILDKSRAQRGGQRIPEKFLHLLEFLGGVVIILPLMYIIRHKNRSANYYLVTYLIFSIYVFIAVTYHDEISLLIQG